MSRMTPETASRYIQSFSKNFGEAHLYLACHAALPVALTPDLLYLLWKNFQYDINGQQLNIPWIAVADLLLSGFCHEVGHELYEMDLPVRNILLKNLQNHQNFGKTRINSISNFLLEYIKPQLSSTDQDIQDLAQTQRLAALAYLNPEQAARELTIAFAKTNQKDIAELLRITSLVETLAEPLSEYEDLLLYSRGVVNCLQGKIDDATIQFLELIGDEAQVTVSGISLPIPEPIKANLSIVETSPNKSLPIIGGGFSALLITILGNFGLLYLQPDFLIQPIPNSTPTPQQTITPSATPTSKPSVAPSQLPVVLNNPVFPIPQVSPLTQTYTPSTSNTIQSPSPSNISPSITPTPLATTPNIISNSTPNPDVGTLYAIGTPTPSATPTLKPSVAPSQLPVVLNNPVFPIPQVSPLTQTSTPSTSNTIQSPSPSNISPSITPTPLATRSPVQIEIYTDNSITPAPRTATGNISNSNNPFSYPNTTATTEPTIASSPLPSNTALTVGDRGYQVRKLQEDLQQLGFYAVSITGYFGANTRDAVANFQRSNGLTSNGIADLQTLALLSQAIGNSNNPNNNSTNNDCSTARGEICLGERSQRVVIVQQRLQQWGVFRGDADGLYSLATRDAVAQFQRARGLAPTGFVDFNTWQALGLSTNQTSPAVQQPQNNNRVNPNNQNNSNNNSLCTGNNVCTVVPER